MSEFLCIMNDAKNKSLEERKRRNILAWKEPFTILLNLLIAFMTYRVHVAACSVQPNTCTRRKFPPCTHTCTCTSRSTCVMTIWCNVSALLVGAEHHGNFDGLLQRASLDTFTERFRSSLWKSRKLRKKLRFLPKQQKVAKKVASIFGKGLVRLKHYPSPYILLVSVCWTCPEA